jgi:thiol:disulfide interchange protein DsbD
MRSIFALALALGFSFSATAADKHKAPVAAAGLTPVTVDGLAWSGDLAAALEEAGKQNRLVFIDFTGVTCTNCRINEKNIFVKADVKNLFMQYVRVQLYTDVIPEAHYKAAPAEEKREQDAEINQKFQKATFKTEQLPLYAIVKPAGAGQFEVVGVYDEGRINKLDKFVEFLKKPLKAE